MYVTKRKMIYLIYANFTPAQANKLNLSKVIACNNPIGPSKTIS